ncbi:MAG: enoyl-CoA hydratase-related protein [Myxococcota bacterium]|nr:enoyl-CoA hydratase-related protein [Myxococcota bacterium]
MTAPDPSPVSSLGLETLALERQGEILRVVIDHPGSELNAVDDQLHRELTALFSALKQDPARAVLLTGRGRAFSAGGDFGWFPSLEDLTTLEPLRRDARQLIWDLLDVPMPIVAALNGPAIGLGASIALLCDTIFMAESASVADPHVRVGIVAGDGGTAIWPLAVGPALAKQYLLTGDPIPASEALRLGLVNRVVADDQLDACAMAFCERLAHGAPLALRYTKQAVNAGVKQALLTSFDVATALEIVTFQSDDHREALAAMREKRPPRFQGR